MKKIKPLVSIIMPAYNAELYISEAIESILNQTFRAFELIIVDDSSTDKTYKIMRSFARKDGRIRIFQDHNVRNIGKVLNRGIDLAQAKIVARMDADDIAYSERLELQYKLIRGSKKIAVVGADVDVINASGRKIAVRRYPVSSKELKECLFRYSPFAHPVVMMRKEYFKLVGGYDPKYSPTEDLDLWFKLGKKFEFKSIPKPLLQYRLFERSTSHKALRNLEMLVFKIRFEALINHVFRPKVYDVLYNLLQFMTVWVMPPTLRIKLYNLLRNNGMI